MKVCHVIELKTPTKIQMEIIISHLMPKINSSSEPLKDKMIHFIQGDLRKLKVFYELTLHEDKDNILNMDILNGIFQAKSYNDDTRKITKKMLQYPFSMDDHLHVMNETDRTIVGLLWHENIIDVLNKLKMEEAIPLYLEMLNNMCFADYIDRITFQRQIWQFNEMSSLIKTFKNNKLFHDTVKKKPKYNPSEIRFTKVLTKYSTEYNNYIFIQNLCQQLGMDKKDLFSFFLSIKNKHSEQEILIMFENYEITKLDINRIYRYLDKYTKENAEEIEDDTASITSNSS